MPQGAVPGPQTLETASLSVTPSGIVLVGCVRDQWANEDTFAFGIKGSSSVKRRAERSGDLRHGAPSFAIRLGHS